MNRAARDYPPGDLRVSDADRDRALSELNEAFQEGRITADEFDDRSGRVLRARTGGELRALLADLPREQVPAMNRVSDVSPRSSNRGPLTLVGIGASAAVVAIVAAVIAIVESGQHQQLFLGHHGAGPGGFGIALVFIIIVLRVVVGRRR